VTVKSSSGSTIVSECTVTGTYRLVVPAGKVSVPDAAVKSDPDVAVFDAVA
jgi:hypothetical protein